MDKLIQLLISCEVLLQSVNETFWTNKIKDVLEESIKRGVNLYLLEDLLSWYGGMGSFNDLILSKYNDHFIKEKDEEKLNEKLNKIRDQIYQEVLSRLKEDSA